LDNHYQVCWLEIVEKKINQLTDSEQARLYKAVELLERNGTALGEPHVKHLRGKIWELRYRFNKKYFRVLYFCSERGLFVLVLLIVKKNNKTRNVDIQTAERRRLEYLEQLKR